MDEAKLHELVEHAIGDLGGALWVALARLGDELGLYRALAASGSTTAAVLAASTDTHERYVREWLNGQAAAGYVPYDSAGTYSLSPEQIELFRERGQPDRHARRHTVDERCGPRQRQAAGGVQGRRRELLQLVILDRRRRGAQL